MFFVGAEIPTKCSFRLVHGQLFPFSVVVHLPKLAVNARNHAKTTTIKSDVLETPVTLMPDRKFQKLKYHCTQNYYRTELYYF